MASQPSTLDFTEEQVPFRVAHQVDGEYPQRLGILRRALGAPGSWGVSGDSRDDHVPGYARSVRALATCHSLTFTQNKKTIRPRFHQFHCRWWDLLRRPTRCGSASGFPIVVDIALFRTSRYLGEVIFSDSVPPQTTALGALARAAAEKANGKIVKIPAISIVSVPVLIAHTTMGDVGYREFGSGPPLVLITGYGGTMESWDPRFVDALAQHHRVVISTTQESARHTRWRSRSPSTRWRVRRVH